jgi:hypothetical protein
MLLWDRHCQGVGGCTAFYYVELYIDGVFSQREPYGGATANVGDVFPEIENASESGYSLAYNCSLQPS